MNKIGFKNFRKFKEFGPLEFGGITFLVGRNNAGKSTLVKALILIIDYLRADTINTFSFNQNNIEDVNIVTFKRALNNQAKQNNDEAIHFFLEIGDFSLNMIITGNDDNTEVDVIGLRIEDLARGFIFDIKPQESFIIISTNSKGNEKEYNNEAKTLNELEFKTKDIEKTLKTIKSKSNSEYIQLNLDLKLHKKKISDLKKSIKSLLNHGQFSLHSNYSSNKLKEILNEALTEHSSEYELQYHDIQKGKKPKKIFESLKAFKDNKFKIEKSIASIFDFQSHIETIYLGATLNKQSALFAIRDKKNPLSQAIHEYKQLGIDKNIACDAYKFVRFWMSESQFEVGDDFDIEMHAGEAYQVTIESNGSRIPLADKGMGSIQTMLLIIRLGVVIHKKQLEDKLKNISNTFEGKPLIVFIEEPELNLHPALQSRLADMFHDVYYKFNIRLIIETHSEYLIRKTQLIVKDKEYEVKPNENPFKIIYFDKELKQWHMNYREDGKFIENFGNGFYDEASLLTFNLL